MRRYLASSGDDKKETIIKSGRKELAYDEEMGRFFELGDDTECIPDEEFCVIDKESGKAIRLTIEEKERIFLDALQVGAESFFAISKWMICVSFLVNLTLCLAWNHFLHYRVF